LSKIRKSIVYQRCEDLASILVNLGYSVVPLRDLEFLLKKHIGADQRTIRKYKDHLLEFNFLKACQSRKYLSSAEVVQKIRDLGFLKYDVTINQVACILSKWFRMGFLKRKFVKIGRRKIYVYMRNGRKLRNEKDWEG